MQTVQDKLPLHSSIECYRHGHEVERWAKCPLRVIPRCEAPIADTNLIPCPRSSSPGMNSEHRDLRTEYLLRSDIRSNQHQPRSAFAFRSLEHVFWNVKSSLASLCFEHMAETKIPHMSVLEINNLKQSKVPNILPTGPKHSNEVSAPPNFVDFLSLKYTK